MGDFPAGNLGLSLGAGFDSYPNETCDAQARPLEASTLLSNRGSFFRVDFINSQKSRLRQSFETLLLDCCVYPLVI